MQILTTRAELNNVRHVAGQGLFWKCSDCGAVAEVGASGTCGTGYGYYSAEPDKPVCYACCGKRERADMIETGRAVLYLTEREGCDVVTNWPGTLSLPVRYKRTGRHNFAGRRYDVWFTGPDGANWHGVQYGDNTQICHARRVKGAR
jgi:hypothetical protein